MVYRTYDQIWKLKLNYVLVKIHILIFKLENIIIVQ